MPEDPKTKKPRNPETGEQQTSDAAGLVGVNTDAINALNAAIGGIQLLSEVVTHIEAAAGVVDSATAGAIKAISASIDSEENKKRIDQLAVDAVARAKHMLCILSVMPPQVRHHDRAKVTLRRLTRPT